MLNVKPKELHPYKIDGKVSYKAGEWYGHKPCHWVGCKQFYDWEIDESNLKPTFKKHYVEEQMRRAEPQGEYHPNRRHYENNIIYKETHQDKHHHLKERLHDFHYINTHSKHPGTVKMYSEIAGKNTDFVKEENFNDIYSPSKNQKVSEEFLSVRNSLPNLKKARINYKDGLYTNLFNKNKSSLPPVKIRDMFSPNKQQMIQFHHDNDNYYDSNKLNKENSRYNSLNTEENKKDYAKAFFQKLETSENNYPFNTKKRVYNLEERRNFIPSLSPGDKNYKSSEFSPGYFKERFVPSSNMKINYDRGSSLNNVNFFNSLVLPKKSDSKKVLKYDYNNKDVVTDRNYVKNLNQWEKSTLNTLN